MLNKYSASPKMRVEKENSKNGNISIVENIFQQKKKEEEEAEKNVRKESEGEKERIKMREKIKKKQMGKKLRRGVGEKKQEQTRRVRF